MVIFKGGSPYCPPQETIFRGGLVAIVRVFNIWCGELYKRS